MSDALGLFRWRLHRDANGTGDELRVDRRWSGGGMEGHTGGQKECGRALLPPVNDLLDVGGQEESEKYADACAPAFISLR